MPARESFAGLRKAFLEGEQEGYKAAVANGTKDDFVMDVVRRFLKRFPVDLADNKEPTAAYLATVDDSSPDEERVPPNPQDMAEDQEGYALALEKYEKTTKLIDFRTKQIARWFNYRFTKASGVKVKAKPTVKNDKAVDLNDPMTIFTLRLLGKPVMRPRKPVDYHLWAKDNKTDVDTAYAAAGIAGAKDLKVYSKICKKLFMKENSTVKMAYKKQAEDEHEEAMKKWEEVFQRPAPKSPASRQVCINGLATSIQPVCDLIAESTGMQVVLLVGGPEPAAGGRLNIIGLHAGGTKGPVQNTFPESDPDKYNNQFIPVFSAHLRKCYTREDCEASALPSNVQSKLTCLDGKQATYVQAAEEDGLSAQASMTNIAAAASTTPSESSSANTSTATLVNAGSTTSPSSDTSPAGTRKPCQTEERDRHKETEPKDTFERGRDGSREKSRGKRTKDSQKTVPSALPSATPNPSKGVEDSPIEAGGLARGKRTRDGEKAASSPLPSVTPDSAKGVRDSVAQAPDLSREKRRKVDHQAASPLSPPATSSSARGVPNLPTEGSDVHPPASVPSPHERPTFATPSSASSSSHFSSLFRPSPPLFSSPGRSVRSPFSSPSHLSSPVQGLASDHEGHEDQELLSQIASPDASSPSSPAPAPSSPSPCVSGEAAGTRRFRAIQGCDNALAARLAARFEAPISPPVFTGPLFKIGRNASVHRSPRRTKERPSNKRAGRSKAAEDPDKENKSCGGKRKVAPTEEKSLAKRRKGSQTRMSAPAPGAGHSSSSSPSPSSPSLSLPSTSSTSSTTSPEPIYVQKTVVFDPSHLSGPYLMAQLPNDCHPGLKNTLIMATSVSWIRVWQLMTAEWVRFEKLNNFKESSKKLKPTYRPAAVGDWIKRARSSTYRPDVDVDKFQTDFWAWYSNIQPKWRSISDGNTPTEVKGKWDDVDVPGVNGWPSVIAALFFWGVALGEKRHQSDSWYLAVRDVYWVLNQLCGSRLY